MVGLVTRPDRQRPLWFSGATDARAPGLASTPGVLLHATERSNTDIVSTHCSANRPPTHSYRRSSRLSLQGPDAAVGVGPGSGRISDSSRAMRGPAYHSAKLAENRR